MCEPANWTDREHYIFEIEKCTSTLNIIADACGNGGYTGTSDVEPALNLLHEHLTKHTKLLREVLWPHESRNSNQRSAADLEYRARFDAHQKAIDENTGICDAGDALRDATDTLLKRPIMSWLDIAELGIVAHDHCWNRFSQRYAMRDCPENILKALVLGILEFGGRDAQLHQAPASWKSPLSSSN